jgi:hypothetical protein
VRISVAYRERTRIGYHASDRNRGEVKSRRGTQNARPSALPAIAHLCTTPLLHEGIITARSQDGGGLEMPIELPLKASAPTE